MRLAVLMAVAAGLAAAKPVRLELHDGSLEFDWLSGSSFHITRSWHINRLPPSTADLDLESTQLKVQVEAKTLRIRVSTTKDKWIADLDAPSLAPGKVLLDRKLAAGERIYGDTGGSSNAPFLFSSAGYGQLIRGAAKYLVDAGKTQADRLRITAQGSDKIDYFFLYGPTPKEIFEQRKLAAPVPEALLLRQLNLDSMNCDDIRRMNNESMSAIFFQEDAGPEWAPFLSAYHRETHDRGLPTIRPLLMQFPKDPNAPKQMDIAMFGDEMIIAPKCAGSVTLPQGLWTNLKTDVEQKGRTTVQVGEPMTIFVRNGSIVPMLRKGVVELHYFPKLPAEFFIFENEANDYTQVHASEAADFWRLEIESKVTRTYEWVLHHIGENPKRIRVEAKAGADHILNLPISESPVVH